MHSKILEAIFRHALADAGKSAIIAVDGSLISYAALKESILRAASFLSSLGLQKGDRIMLSADKELEFIYLYLGAHLAGIVNVVVDASNNRDNLSYIASAANPDAIFGFSLDGYSCFDYQDINLENFSLFDDFPEIPENDTADIMFTSGTTGHPKGVILSYANIAGSAENINSFIGNKGDDVELLALPVCHSFGLGRLRCNLLTGATVVLHRGFANLKSLFNTMERYRVTGFGMVPAVWAYIRRFSGERIGKFAPQIRYIEIGSASLPIEEKRKIMELFPSARICMHYGLTEASRSAFIEFNSSPNHLDSIGKEVTDKVEIRIFDEMGDEVADGCEGELCVKGNMVTSGYLDPENNKEAFFGEYFRTGDGARRDEEGMLYLVGRIKEIINVGGKKVSPAEIEDVVEKICGADSVCVAIDDPDGILGEVPKLLVAKDSLKISINELEQLLRQNLEPYKLPRFIELIDSIPRTPSGKKQRLKARQ